ncbi:MAG TPA: TM2 domain-containing protein, partial [Acidimicrobiales bacterium]
MSDDLNPAAEPPPPPPQDVAPPPPPPPPAPATMAAAPAGMTASGKPMPRLEDASGKKLAAGICGILLGAFGVHKFILGYTSAGLIMLLVTVLTCGIAGVVFSVIGIIEGLIYLTKSDE